MTLNIQIAVDCRDPHTLADWWAETLEWAVEPQDEDFIRSMIAQGFATEAETTRHHGKLVWGAGAAIRPPEELDAKPPARRILFQTVPEEKTIKNRIHWDVNLAGADKDEARAALEARGATYLWSASQGPHSWHTMADPEGNEFCIS
ncbi:VOC family protein [Pseudarthrobacter sp. PvP090]|uniref:VOC family protein n=1 Tax=Pseudarthrobacter sp. PvP090 TaxID=3156393 RepID=UPI0033947625